MWILKEEERSPERQTCAEGANRDHRLVWASLEYRIYKLRFMTYVTVIKKLNSEIY